MYTKDDLLLHMKALGIDPKGTLLVHSSMKAIGQVEGGAETVLDALMEYMKDGLLVLPTHTWDKINKDNPVMDAAKDGTCVGILTNLFLKRPGVIRSLHPTHSVAAFGPEAEEYVRGEEKCTSPCPREGCWGKLYDRKAQILLLGVKLNRYTYIHSIEEWMDIPGRLTDGMEQLAVIAPSCERFETPQHRHMGLPSETFPKMDEIFRETGAMRLGRFGDAECRLCDAVRTAEVVMAYLKHNPELFSDDAPAGRIAL